jgi:hypothetical protein
MHTLHARSALTRGMHMVAGMLSIHTVRNTSQAAAPAPSSGFRLVSWSPGAHSRREDELARSRLLAAHTANED